MKPIRTGGEGRHKVNSCAQEQIHNGELVPRWSVPGNRSISRLFRLMGCSTPLRFRLMTSTEILCPSIWLYSGKIIHFATGFHSKI